MIFWMGCALLSLVAVVWLTRPFWRRDAERRPMAATAMALAVLVPALALGGYLAQGSWRTQQNVEQATAQPEQAQAQMIQGMVERLAARLKENPNDLEGWSKLGRSYSVLGRYPESAEAYARANAISKNSNAELLIGETEALAMATEDHRLEGRPTELLTLALKAAPDDPHALWLSGLAAAQRADYKSAEQHWHRLLKQPRLPENFRADLQQRLDEIAKLKTSDHQN